MALRDSANGDVALDPVNCPLNAKLPDEEPNDCDQTPSRR